MEKISNIVILCIGTNKLIGDTIGPVVGQKLTRVLSQNNNVKIYGNIKKTLNLKNAKQVLEEITCRYPEAFIITIDAALGPKETIETIYINSGKIKIGEALGHNIEYISNVNIKAIVGEYQQNLQKDIETLNKVKRKCIHRLSNQITYDVCQIIEKINNV